MMARRSCRCSARTICLGMVLTALVSFAYTLPFCVPNAALAVRI